METKRDQIKIRLEKASKGFFTGKVWASDLPSTVLGNLRMSFADEATQVSVDGEYSPDYLDGKTVLRVNGFALSNDRLGYGAQIIEVSDTLRGLFDTDSLEADIEKRCLGHDLECSPEASPYEERADSAYESDRDRRIEEET